MPQVDPLETPEGRLVQHRRRERRRILIYLDDVEPQSKKMVDADKDAFQRKVLKELKDLRRAAFVGPLALSVHLSTTRATAPQAHTIAKNLLDLLGSRRPSVRGSRKHILYKDDSQVHGLSVSCAHGETQPRIVIEARPFSTLLDNLELSAEALRESRRTILVGGTVPIGKRMPSPRSSASCKTRPKIAVASATSCMRRW